MRIISGEARGRTLFAPSGEETRPTSDKIRGSMFNIIGSRVYDAHVLDLFGGTGALALEALSRGAAFAMIADNAKAAIQAIERNAQNVLKDELAQRAKILRADYRTAIAAANGIKFDLVFLDPPYRLTDVYCDALEQLRAQGSLAAGCLIVLERGKDLCVPLPTGFESYDTRNYGVTSVEFVRETVR